MRRCLSTACLALLLSPVLLCAGQDAPASALEAVSGRIVAQADTAEAVEAAVLVLQAITRDDDDDEDGVQIRIIGGEGALTPGKFWVGLDCATIDPAARENLGLGEAEGLLIRTVLPESPAAAAGLQANDVITQAKLGDAETKLTGVAQLSGLIQQSAGKPVTLTVLRSGKPLTMVVRPAERPGVTVVAGEERSGKPREIHKDRREEMIKRLKERVREGQPAQWPSEGPRGERPQGLQFRMTGPVVVKLGEDMAKVPDDLKISITRTGNQPAEISVAQGDKKWTVKDNELDKLPPEMRINLAKSLGLGIMSKLRGTVPGGMPFGGPFKGPWGAMMPPGGPHEAGRETAHCEECRKSAGKGCPHCQRQQAKKSQHRHGKQFTKGQRHRGKHHGRNAGHHPRGRGHQQASPQCHSPAGHCPMCAARHAGGQRGHGPGMMHGPGFPQGLPMGQSPADARLEMLLTRLEQILRQHPAADQVGAGIMLGRPGAPHAGGGFGAPTPGGAPGAASPWRELKVQAPATGQVQNPNPAPRAGGPGPDELRSQLQKMQEQQDKMARAIRDLAEALERLQQRK